jgi:superfamily II DNA or RNA helicase
VIILYKIPFRVSYSTMKLFYDSPLQFYFNKIKGIEVDQRNVYGDLGNAVHKGIQAYIEDFNNADNIFREELEKITDETGMFGEPIDKRKIVGCFTEGKGIIDIWRDEYNKLYPEMKIQFEIDIDGIIEEVIGYIDCVIINDREITVHDWKTNSTIPKDEFIEQAKFYSYLIYKKYERIPRCMWHMLKLGKTLQHQFSVSDILQIEAKIKNFVRKVREYGMDVRKYDEGNWNNVFNNHKDYCQREIDRRTKNDSESILKVERKGNSVYFTNLKDTKLLRGLDLKFSYFVDGYIFSDLYKKRIWDGKKHVFSINKRELPMGLYNLAEEFIDEYNKRFGTNYIIEFVNKQDEKVTNKEYKTIFKNPPFELRDYQNEAVNIALRKKIGIINLPTGVGKSVIIGEVLKKINKRSLIIVSRIELLQQLKNDIEDWTGTTVGEMAKGKLDINNQFTVSSIQTIYSILKRKDESSKLLIKYLYNVAVTVFDEAHLVRNVNMYSVVSKFCVNSEYIIGTTATDWRNDCHTLLMNASVGNTIYKKTPQQMEEEGWILPTKCYFVKCKGETSGDYHSAYKSMIVHNKERNLVVRDLCEKYSQNFKILIITKMIDHGKLLNQMIDNSYLITSQTKTNDRKEWFDDFKKSDKKVLIGSSQIFAQGINIPSLDIIINVGAHVSDVTSIQVVGRVKRTNKETNKKHSYYIDFFDIDKNYFEKASKERINILEEFGNQIVFVNDVEEIEIK